MLTKSFTYHIPLRINLKFKCLNKLDFTQKYKMLSKNALKLNEIYRNIFILLIMHFPFTSL
ncbi:unnamed protein product [Meloidogyne enterolobii]|uniref:Uncharacterized protein n=1 Tax=Meloidogyne enterolobii TaxID=390850 RepID=A0ACB0Z2X3_MELEN